MSKDDLREVLELVRAKLVSDTEAACLWGDCEDCEDIHILYGIVPEPPE